MGATKWATSTTTSSSTSSAAPWWVGVWLMQRARGMAALPGDCVDRQRAQAPWREGINCVLVLGAPRRHDRRVNVPISTNAAPVKVMGEASADGLFTLAQTNGMMRARTAGMPGKTAISRKGPLAWTSATVNKQRQQID